LSALDSTDPVLRARREALLVRIASRLRLLSDPGEILTAAVAMMAEEVDASRLGYAEVDEGADLLDIQYCLVRDGSFDISGQYPLGGVGAEFHEDLRRGNTIRVDDITLSTALSEELRQSFQAAAGVAVLTVPVISATRYRAMLFAHHHEAKHWTDHDELLLHACIEQLWRELSRARAETALRDSEERYRRIFEQASDLIITADLSQVITDVNPAVADAIGLERHEIVGRSMADFLSPASMARAKETLAQKLAHGGTTNHELDVIAQSGRVLHWEVNSTLTLDPSGKPVGLHAIARDVTERRRAEERQLLLVNELNHRVKNTLALVQGLALQSFKDGRDMGEARHAFQHRLAALAAAHDLLTRESWEGATLDEVVVQALGHHNVPEPRILWDGPGVTLNPKAAVSLVMALHELSTNAHKYGALSAPEGRVSLRWSVDGGRLRIEWREQGGPMVQAPGRRGFGFRMIERALASDLSGGATIDFEPAGLVCRIDASLSDAASRTATA
jgi:PAS domain S-box-containing protein